MNKVTLGGILATLEGIHSDLDHGLGDLEGEAPDHMKFDKVNDAKDELREEIHLLRKWLDKFSIESIEQSIY